MPSGPPVNMMLPPSHTGPSLEAVASGLAYTVTLVLSLAVHPLKSVTVTVYVVLPLGEAVGLATAGSLKPSVGLQLYVYGGVPFVAVGLPPICTESPAQTAWSGPASAIGGGEGWKLAVIE